MGWNPGWTKKVFPINAKSIGTKSALFCFFTLSWHESGETVCQDNEASGLVLLFIINVWAKSLSIEQIYIVLLLTISFYVNGWIFKIYFRILHHIKSELLMEFHKDDFFGPCLFFFYAPYVFFD